MFEGFAYVAAALIGGYGALTGYLPAMLIALFGDISVLTGTSGQGRATIPSLLNPSGTPQPPDNTKPPPWWEGGGLIAGLTNYTQVQGGEYQGSPLGPGGPVITANMPSDQSSQETLA